MDRTMRQEKYHVWYVNRRAIVFAALQGDLGTDWTAYMSAFDGDANEEYMKRQTRDHGDKIPQAWAEGIFPRFAEEFTWRW